MLVITDSSIMDTLTGKLMKKKIQLAGALSIYEILRLCTVLAVQAESSQARLPVSWYMSVPLLALPFYLLYVVYKNGVHASFAAELYGIIKIAGIAAFMFFIYDAFGKTVVNFPLNKTEIIKTLVYMMPFFIIDVILSVFIMIKVYKTRDKTEGEPCK